MTSKPIARAPWRIERPRIAKTGFIDPALRCVVRDRADGCCELCGERLGPVFECHHRKLRSRGGQDSAANLLALCSTCHRRCHEHVAWATEQGFIVASHDDPQFVPVALHLSSWVTLHHDGTYRDAP
jgi:5-methylcytosine-specific restriction endonuclease McrA